ncbi:hypothetical protein OIU12_26695, partial [Escherichia coli]|nr:hypothetical protein [Escherichia coli]
QGVLKKHPFCGAFLVFWGFKFLSIKAVHAKLCGVQTLYLSTPRSLTVLYRQSYPAWCQSVHNFSIGAAYHR